MNEEKSSLTIDADTLVELGKSNARIITEKDAQGIARPFAIHPQGFEISELTKFLPPKEEAHKVFATPESFAAYFNRFKREGSLVTSSLKDGSINAIFDYHRVGKGGAQEHRATYAPDLSSEFNAWKTMIGDYVTQRKLAEFLNSYGHTVTTPSEGEMRDIVENVEGTINASVKSVTSTRDGSGEKSFRVAVTLKTGANGDFDMPSHITITLPVYRGGESVAITLKLQTDVGENGLKFKFIAPKLEDLIRAMNERAVATVAQAINETIYAQP